jgi:hypothetical protein
MRIPEFCRRYRVGRSTTFTLIKTGRLRAKKIGAITIITPEDAERWLRSLPVIGARREGTKRSGGGVL